MRKGGALFVSVYKDNKVLVAILPRSFVDQSIMLFRLNGFDLRVMNPSNF